MSLNARLNLDCNIVQCNDGRISHLHVNDYGGGYMDWAHMQVLPVDSGYVDFDTFFKKLGEYDYMGDFTVESTALAKDGSVEMGELGKYMIE